MEIPEELEGYKHDEIVASIQKLNPTFKQPTRTAWPNALPDLEDPRTRAVVEVELSDLRAGWGQCLYYYRMGASKIHFVLAPNLYKEYGDKENKFIRENPIPLVTVYSLPPIIIPSSQTKKKKTIHTQIVPNISKFVAPDKDYEVPISRKRMRIPVLIIRKAEESMEDNIFEFVKEKSCSKSCFLCNSQMKLRIYTNNFGDETRYFECSCGHMENREI